MPVFRLPEYEISFPHPRFADSSGILAIGGDLNPERLLLAYQNGIFPWYEYGEEILWWCITPRLILNPKKIKVSKSMRNILNQNKFQIKFDTQFIEVMHSCRSTLRKGQSGSWIHYELMDAFIKLHQAHYAHSVEVYQKDELVGGLYGLSIGRMFCGESMFSKIPNASKVALISLCSLLEKKGFELIDCQQDTPHLRSMGAELISRNDFFRFLETNQSYEMIQENWNRETKVLD